MHPINRQQVNSESTTKVDWFDRDSLGAEVRRLTSDNTRLREELARYHAVESGKDVTIVASDVMRLSDENAELRKDKERLEWIIANKRIPQLHENAVGVAWPDLRAAIDSSITKGAE